MRDDDEFSLLDLPYLIARVETCDVVVGYRYRRADPWHRLLNAWAWNQLVRRVLAGLGSERCYFDAPPGVAVLCREQRPRARADGAISFLRGGRHEPPPVRAPGPRKTGKKRCRPSTS